MKRDAKNARPARRSLRQRGLTLIEASLVLGMMAIVVVVIGNTLADNAERVKGKATADRLAQVHDASAAYIKANYAKLVAVAPNAPSALAIPVTGASGPSGTTGTTSLVNGGFLPSGFQNVNPYGQQHAVLVRRLGSNGLEALVTTTGGQVIPDAQLGRIATQRGAAGGFVASNPVRPGDAGWITGSFGGWRTQASTWGAAATRPSAGRVQSTLAFEDGGMIADYLYRNDIGIPEANRMNTSIDMASNDLNNVRTVNAQTVNAQTGNIRQVNADNVVAEFDLWAKRNVIAGNDVTAGRDVTAARTVTASTGDVVATAGNVRAGASVVAGLDVEAGRNLGVAGNGGIGGNLDVTGEFKTAQGVAFSTDLKATEWARSIAGLDIDLLVFNSQGNLGKGQGIRLRDLLPRTVAQYSYLVGPGQLVAKPRCVGGNDNARIMIYRQTESNRAPINGTATGTFMGGVTLNIPDADVVDSVQAAHAGDFWQVTWSGNQASPGAARRALAQTFCYYPNQ